MYRLIARSFGDLKVDVLYTIYKVYWMLLREVAFSASGTGSNRS